MPSAIISYIITVSILYRFLIKHYSYIVSDVLLLSPGEESALGALHGQLAGVGRHSLAVSVVLHLVL